MKLAVFNFRLMMFIMLHDSLGYTPGQFRCINNKMFTLIYFIANIETTEKMYCK